MSIEHGLRLANILSDAEAIEDFADKISTINSIATTAMACFISHVRREHRASEIIRVIERAKLLAEALDEVSE